MNTKPPSHRLTNIVSTIACAAYDTDLRNSTAPDKINYLLLIIHDLLKRRLRSRLFQVKSFNPNDPATLIKNKNKSLTGRFYEALFSALRNSLRSCGTILNK